jgi:hypothetical protein
MRMKGILITKDKTKKGSYVYNFLTKDNEAQIVLRVLSKNDYVLNKEIEIDLNLFDFKKIYFERNK